MPLPQPVQRWLEQEEVVDQARLDFEAKAAISNDASNALADALEELRKRGRALAGSVGKTFYVGLVGGLHRFVRVTGDPGGAVFVELVEAEDAT